MALVEDDVAGHLHALGLWVEDAVHLGAVGVSDEDARLAAIIHLLHLVLMDKSCVAGLCGAVVAHMVLVAVFLFLGQHLRLEDSILD